MTYNRLTTCTWNAKGLKNRKAQLINFIHTHNIDIQLINETKLKHTDKFKIRGYTIYRKDRPAIHASGGVAIAIKNNIPHTLIQTPPTSLETLTIKLSDNTHITAAYNKPRNQFTHIDIHTLLNTARKSLIVGDLNARHEQWNCHIRNTNGNTLHNVMLNTNTLIQYPDTPTLHPSNNTTPTTIDIIINQNTPHVSQPISHTDLNSDHNPVTFTLNTPKPPEHYRLINDYTNTNWKHFRRTLDEHITINNHITTTDELEDEVTKLTHVITNAKRKHSHTKKINAARHTLPQHIHDLIKQRNHLRTQWQRNRDTVTRTQMTHMSRQINTEISTHLNIKWQNKLETLHPQDNTLWKLAKSLTKTHKPIPTLEHRNTHADTDTAKANALADIFEQIHNNDTPDTEEQRHINETVHTYLNTQHPDETQQLKKTTDNTSRTCTDNQTSTK